MTMSVRTPRDTWSSCRIGQDSVPGCYPPQVGSQRAAGPLWRSGRFTEQASGLPGIPGSWRAVRPGLDGWRALRRCGADAGDLPGGAGCG